ncbi:MAG: lytic transglycosylase domain-containing protein [Treponema sp.]|nr:lytic transglycosylase domain-containing protein [Treponema sp.]
MTACKGQEVVEVNQEEVIQKFKSGDIGFIMKADPMEVWELAKINPSASFYAGLMVRTQEQAGVDSAQEHIRASLTLFQAALGSPAIRIREEAARELVMPVLAGEVPANPLLSRLKNTAPKPDPRNKPSEKLITLPQNNPVLTLHAAALYTLGRYNETMKNLETQKEFSNWDKSISLAAALGLQKQNTHIQYERTSPEKNILRGKFLNFLLTGPPDKSYQWTFREVLRQEPEFFSEAETAAVLGRFAVSESRAYGEALRHFRFILEQDRSLFFQYPELTGDLGRSFQYTNAASQAEGITLFLEWDKALQSGLSIDNGFSRGNPGIDTSQVHFRVLYYLGRIERERKKHAQAAIYFTAALPYAPDPLQKDACIWYILNTTWLNKRENLRPAHSMYIQDWQDPSYFADMMDLLCCYLTANRQWQDMLELFPQIWLWADKATVAKYAYILGRGVSEEYISVTAAANTLHTVGMGGLFSPEEQKKFLARTFFRIAFEEKNASFYYRVISASRLGDGVSPIPVESEEFQEQEGPQDFPNQDEMELLVGFFEFGASLYSLPYIKDVRDRLSVLELRIIAQALTDHKHWIEAIRLVNVYMEREDYEVSRQDLILSYPRAFRDIIEANAKEAGISPEILYGLIRTESYFDPNIMSSVGAIGLSQLMPDTAREQAERIKKQGGPDYLEHLNLQDPGINVHIGTFYLKYLFDLMKSPMQALLSYNGGYNRVRRWRNAELKLPEDLFVETIELIETREYGKRVLGAAAAYGYLYFDMPMEAVVAEIFR